MREEGVSRITVFPLTKDEVGTMPEYGLAEKIQNAISFDTEDQMKSSNYYSDNSVEETKNSISSISVTMEISSGISIKQDALLTGKKYKNGSASKKTGQRTPALAVAYEIIMGGGENLRRRIIYNVGFTRPSQKNKGIEEETTGQTYEYKGTGIPLKSTQELEYTMDLNELESITDESEKTQWKKKWDEFFTSPQFLEELQSEEA